MEEIIMFILTFLFIFIFYQLLFIIPAKKKYSKKEDRKELLEVHYLQTKYHLDMDKVPYFQLLQICGIVSSFDISVVVSVISYVKGFFGKIFIGFIMIIPIIMISYHLVYLFYKKKGMIKNG